MDCGYEDVCSGVVVLVEYPSEVVVGVPSEDVRVEVLSREVGAHQVLGVIPARQNAWAKNWSDGESAEKEHESEGGQVPILEKDFAKFPSVDFEGHRLSFAFTRCVIYPLT